jgi:hypothetical protein
MRPAEIRSVEVRPSIPSHVRCVDQPFLTRIGADVQRARIDRERKTRDGFQNYKKKNRDQELIEDCSTKGHQLNLEPFPLGCSNVISSRENGRLKRLQNGRGLLFRLSCADWRGGRAVAVMVISDQAME